LFKPESFSFIFILQTLDHIPNPREFLADCLAVLKPGGFILSYHHDVSSWSAALLGEKSPIFDIEHTYLYDHRTSCLLLEKSGFVVRRAYSPLNVLSLYHLVWLSPLPLFVKNFLLKKNSFTKQLLHSIEVQVPLGNTCIIGQKPTSIPRQVKNSLK
jgi:SAM-dependent methyltransferase